MIFIGYLDLVLFALCAFTVVYLLIYAIAATVKRTDKYSESRIKHRFAILIPAYKDDEYVFYAIRSFLQQDYPIDCFDIIVISDHLKSETNRQLAQLPIILLKANFKKSSKTKSIKAAMSQLADSQYDIALLMNADNVVEKNFLNEINNTYASGSNAIQSHRIHKDRPNNIIVLDAVADEINNSILRAGHVTFGLSASLNGSGTAIDFNWLKENIRKLSDEDDEKTIESLLLRIPEPNPRIRPQRWWKETVLCPTQQLDKSTILFPVYQHRQPAPCHFQRKFRLCRPHPAMVHFPAHYFVGNHPALWHNNGIF